MGGSGLCLFSVFQMSNWGSERWSNLPNVHTQWGWCLSPHLINSKPHFLGEILLFRKNPDKTLKKATLKDTDCWLHSFLTRTSHLQDPHDIVFPLFKKYPCFSFLLHGKMVCVCVYLLLLFNWWIVSNSLRPHGLWYTRPPCPSLSPRCV